MLNKQFLFPTPDRLPQEFPFLEAGLVKALSPGRIVRL
jgi:hypothetical protein